MALWEGLWEGLWKTSENLWKPLKTSKDLWKALKSSETIPLRGPLRDPLRGRFPSQNLSGLLPLIVLPLKLLRKAACLFCISLEIFNLAWNVQSRKAGGNQIPTFLGGPSFSIKHPQDNFSLQNTNSAEASFSAYVFGFLQGKNSIF